MIKRFSWKIAALAAITLIIGVSIGLFALYNLPGSTNLSKFDFKLASNNSSCTIMQGESVQIAIDVIQTNGTAEPVFLSSNIDLTGTISDEINCSFNPSSGKGNFSAIATLTALNSIIHFHSLHNVNFLAESKTMNYSLPFSVNVLNSQIGVSGKIILPNLPYPKQIGVSLITITDSKTNQAVFQSSSDTSQYSVRLKNHNTYLVSIYWVYSPFFESYSRRSVWNTSFYVDAEVGQDKLTQDFSLSDYYYTSINPT
jgi:hypothetical protein